MQNKININSRKKILIIYIVLTLATLAVFGQVNKFDFVNFDDDVYITENNFFQSGITLDGLRWAFSTTYAEFWHPLTWLSLMFDNQLYGFNPGGYHLTNLILHILSTLLLLGLFNRMTGAIWKSAFVAALFALHPLHVETVAWITKRKDVLSAFFWMLTLCLYVYYTEKPLIKRYLLVIVSFVCALMSKPMVVTLPVIMILLDYWPLGRLQSKQGNFILWQLKEKTPFFILSAVFSIITIYTRYNWNNPFVNNLPLSFRLANAPVSFITYLEKTFWPHDLAVFYPFAVQIPVWQVLSFTLLIIVISVAVIKTMKRLPHLFVGWLWYSITLFPVIGIIQVSYRAMSDNYTYLPSIGIAIMLAWGIPLLFPSEHMRKKILLPAGITVIAILVVLTWRQCSYWKNSFELWEHTLHVTTDNYLAHNNIGMAYYDKGKKEEAVVHFNKSISVRPDYAAAYTNRGIVYADSGQYQLAIEDFNKAIKLKPDEANFYYNRGTAYFKIDDYQSAIDDYSTVISMNPDYIKPYNSRAIAYENRGVAYEKTGDYHHAIEDYSKAIRLISNNGSAYTNRGISYFKLGQYQLAIEDFNKAIIMKPDYAEAYFNRAVTYFAQGNKGLGCRDAQKACDMGACKALKAAQGIGLCRMADPLI